MKLKRISAVIAAAVISFTMATPMTVHADEWVKTDSGYVYEYDDGTTAEKGWLTVDKDKYYIQKDGTRKTGWLKTTSSKYYFGKDGKMTETGKKYHYDNTCNGGTYYKSTLEDAKDRGLTPCKKCIG